MRATPFSYKLLADTMSEHLPKGTSDVIYSGMKKSFGTSANNSEPQKLTSGDTITDSGKIWRVK